MKKDQKKVGAEKNRLKISKLPYEMNQMEHQVYRVWMIQSLQGVRQLLLQHRHPQEEEEDQVYQIQEDREHLQNLLQDQNKGQGVGLHQEGHRQLVGDGLHPHHRSHLNDNNKDLL